MCFNLLLKLMIIDDAERRNSVCKLTMIIVDRLHSHLWTKCSCLELTEATIRQNQDNHQVWASLSRIRQYHDYQPDL